MNAYKFIDKYGIDGLIESISVNKNGFIARGNDFANVKELKEAIDSYEFNNYEIEQDFDFMAGGGDVVAKVSINGIIRDVILVEFSGNDGDFLAPVVEGFSVFNDDLFEDYKSFMASFV